VHRCLAPWTYRRDEARFLERVSCSWSSPCKATGTHEHAEAAPARHGERREPHEDWSAYHPLRTSSRASTSDPLRTHLLFGCCSAAFEPLPARLQRLPGAAKVSIPQLPIRLNGR
jgi:hypothetical protein